MSQTLNFSNLQTALQNAELTSSEIASITSQAELDYEAGLLEDDEFGDGGYDDYDPDEKAAVVAKALEDERAGVSLDEEAASLIQFQQAFSANARIIQTARELFDSLMMVVSK